jgi:hypothetical protein
MFQSSSLDKFCNNERSFPIFTLVEHLDDVWVSQL